MTHFINPQKNDVLGDDWSRKVREAWDKMKEVDVELTSKPCAYYLWQWAMCTMAGMEHRVIASPQACMIAADANGTPKPDPDILKPLLELSDKILQEMFG